jgi:hypothetical protein
MGRAWFGEERITTQGALRSCLQEVIRELGELSSEQFDELINRVADPVVWDCGRGRPRELTLRQAVKAAVMYFHTNVT